jgi:cytochrome c553
MKPVVSFLTSLSFLIGATLATTASAEEAPASAKPDLAKGQATAAVCGACHTADGSRGSPANPILAGQHPSSS